MTQSCKHYLTLIKTTDNSDNEIEGSKIKKIKLNKDSDNEDFGVDVTFVDKRPVHMRDRLIKITGVAFVKKTPQHPRDGLIRRTEIKMTEEKDDIVFAK